MKRVEVRVVGNERVISPADQTWDSFFIGGETATVDFMTERASQSQTEREAL